MNPLKSRKSHTNLFMSVFLRTSLISKWKIAFDTLKDFLVDVNLVFGRDDDKNAGMTVMEMDPAKNVLVHFTIPAAEIRKYGTYSCSIPCTAGINISEFYKLLKTINR